MSQSRVLAADLGNVRRTTSVLHDGCGQSKHIYVGRNGAYDYATYIRFAMDWTNVGKIVSATLNLYTDEYNTFGPAGEVGVMAAPGATDIPTIGAQRLTAAFTEGNNVDGTFNSSDYVSPTHVATEAVSKVMTPGGADLLHTMDVTAMVRAWAPSTVEGGGRAPNYGLVLSGGLDSTKNWSGWSRKHTGGGGASERPTITLVYEYGPTIPNTPQNLVPSGNVATLPQFEGDFSDIRSTDILQSTNIEIYDAGTAATAAVTDIITSAAHGLLAGDFVYFTSLTGGVGLSIFTRYCVRDVTTNTFKVTASATSVGAVVDITTLYSAMTWSKQVGAISKIASQSDAVAAHFFVPRPATLPIFATRTYRWRAQCTDQEGQTSAWTGLVSFVLTNTPPNAPTLSPASGSSYASLNLVKFRNSADLTTYAAIVRADNPRAYWRLGEKSGAIAADELGSNPGTYQGGPTLGVARPLPLGLGADFSNLASDVTIPNNALLNLGDGPLTIEAWVKLNNTVGATLYILDRGANGYSLGYYGDTGAVPHTFFLGKAGVARISVSSVTLTDTTQWHHVAATKNGAGVHSIYLDGVDVTSFFGDQTLADPAAPATIGASSVGNNTFPGVISEAAIYPVVLSAARIAAHAARAAGGFSDPDAGDTLSAHQVQLSPFPVGDLRWDEADGILWDTGMILESSAQPPILFDDFDTPGLNARWGQNYKPSGLPTAQNDRTLATVIGDGNLRIKAVKKADGLWYSTSIDTKLTVKQRYGYYEARIKIPKGVGLWPSGPWGYDDATAQEIDGMEIYSNPVGTAGADVDHDVQALHTTVHWDATTGQDATSISGYPSTRTGIDLSLAYHVYGFDWQPDHISWYLDGVLVKSYTNTTRIPNVALPVIIGLGVGVPVAPDGTTPNPSTMLVDWVRISAAPATGQWTTLYGGKALKAGTYYWRARVWDNKLGVSAWTYATIILTADFNPDPGSYSNVQINTQPPWRILIRDLYQPDGVTKTIGRAPGNLIAVLEEAKNVGASIVYNSPGELHFTLLKDDAQLPVIEPKQVHYAVEFFSGDGWQEKYAGVIWDVDATETDIIFKGIDYLALYDTVIDERYDPLKPNKSYTANGSFYENVTIRTIVMDQLNRAKALANSWVGFIAIGQVDAMGELATVYSTMQPVLTFVAGLIDSHRQGTGKRTRMKVVKTTTGTYQLQIVDDPGVIRSDLAMYYGELVQGYRLIVFGDNWANVQHIVGRNREGAKVVYQTVSGQPFQPSQTTYGRIAAVAVMDGVQDQSDLNRRGLQAAIQSAKLGKNVAIGIRTEYLAPLQGWDICDVFPLTIIDGAINTTHFGSGYWTAAAAAWEATDIGQQSLVITLLPREDASAPSPDLLVSHNVSTQPEWQLGWVPPDPVKATSKFWLDQSTGKVYQRNDSTAALVAVTGTP